MDEPQTTPLDANTMEALLNNRVTRAMLADNTGTPTVSSSAMLPDPLPPQMNNSLKIARELDPEGILDRDINSDTAVNSDTGVKRDGEAIDPCHTLSSSESEEEDTAEATVKEMDVDQQPVANPTDSTIPEASPATLSAASTGSKPGNIQDPDPDLTAVRTAPSFDTATAPTQSGSGSGSTMGGQGQASDSSEKNFYSQFDPNSELGKAILKKKFKIPNMPKNSAIEKVPSGVKNPVPTKTVNPIPAEADAVPSKTYTKIITSKLLKGKVGTIGGITSGQGNSECGSFFNKGDNRVLRSVYKEDISTMSVSSLSFNPVKWVCSSCPSSHPVFGGGGGVPTGLS